MKEISLLVVEGNLASENKNFKEAGIQTHTESLKESIANYHNKINYSVLNPSSEENFNEIISKLESFNGIVWGGSSLNIYNDTPEIRRQIYFMKECFKKVKNILAICWGMQVAVTAAGGVVRKSKNGAHIGIAKNIKINSEGLKHPIYKDKKLLKSVIKNSFILSATSSLIICVIFLIGKNSFIEIMTDIPDIREISFAYSNWVVIIPFISSFCFQFDGIFVGASQTKELRNAMIISVGIYVLSSFYLLANFGNTGLWISLCIFFIARALTLFVYLGKIIGRV